MEVIRIINIRREGRLMECIFAGEVVMVSTRLGQFSGRLGLQSWLKGPRKLSDLLVFCSTLLLLGFGAVIKIGILFS